MLHIINERLKIILLSQMTEKQADFIRRKGTREQIFNLRHIIEKRRQYNQETYL